MHATTPSSETGLAEHPESRGNDSGGAESAAALIPGRTRPALVTEPFPSLVAGELVLDELVLVRVHDEPTLGKYRVEQRAPDAGGPVFLVTLFGATASKVAMMSRRRLDWPDYLAAMKHAIEREIGYWQKRRQPLPRSVEPELALTVRDTDFSVP